MAGTAGWTRPQEHDVRMRAWVWANENPGWVSAILDSVSARRESAWCVLIRTESKIGRNFGATALLLWDPPPFFLLLLFCRELRLLFLKALCVYDDEKSLWSSSSSLEQRLLLLFHFLASRKLLSHAETLIKERERRPLFAVENSFIASMEFLSLKKHPLLERL